MTNGLELTPDFLAAHGRALRGIARSLLRDADAAEDVVQETWLACLRYPGTLPVRLSSWLGTVAGRLALRRKRGETRRRTREERAATPERLEALQQRALERDESLRAVTEALLALEEPFKTALYLRFFEERTPGEIAAELDLPVTTVKSRITRGLERLRARLSSELGDEARLTRALLVLAGAPAPFAPLGRALQPVAAAQAASIGALGAALELKVAAALVLVAGGTALLWQRSGDEQVAAQAALLTQSSSASAKPAGPARPAADTRAPSATGDESVSGREAVAPEAPAAAAVEAFPSEPSYLYRIAGIVRDEHDLPLSGARVFLAPRGLPLNRVAITDDEGRFALEFAGRRATLDCAFTADHHGRELGLHELHLVAGRDMAIDVALVSSSAWKRLETPEPGNTAQGIIAQGITEQEIAEQEIAEQGLTKRALVEQEITEQALASSADASPQTSTLEYVFEEGARPLEVRVASEVLALRLGSFLERDSADPLDRAPELLRTAEGRGIFVDPLPTQACRRSKRDVLSQVLVEDLKTTFEASKRDFRIQLATGLDARFVMSTLEGAEPTPRATLRGVVHDALGEPLANVVVGWGRPGRNYEDSTTSDERGAFVLTDVPPGEVFVQAGGGDEGRARKSVTLADGQELAWDAQLERGNEVAGRVVLAGRDERSSRDALAGMRVELWSTGPSSVWCAATTTDTDGRFAFPNAPAGALEVHVFAAGVVQTPSAFPVRVLGPRFAPDDVGEIVLEPKDLGPHTLTAELLDARGEALPGAELRVWQVATGLGRFASVAEEGKLLTLDGLPAGAYRVEAGGPLGWRDLGQVWVADGEREVKLGATRFADPGLLALEAAPEGDAKPKRSLWSAHPDVFGHVAQDDALAVPLVVLNAGDYVLCAGKKDAERAETALHVQSAQTSGVLPHAPESAGVRIQLGDGEVTLALREHTESCTSCHSQGN